MRILSFLLCLVACYSLSAQSFLNKVDETPGTVSIKQYLDSYTIYEFDKKAFVQLFQRSSELTISLNIEDRLRHFQLSKTNILSSDYKLFSSRSNIDNSGAKYSFYYGVELNNDKHKIGVMLIGDEVEIFVYDNKGAYSISKDAQGRYVGYYDEDRKQELLKEWSCTVEESRDEDPLEIDGERSTNESACITVFIEVDHNMYNKHNGNLENIEAWVLNIMSQVAILYIEHDIPITVSGIQVWDEADPYVSATNTSQALSLFRNEVRNNPNNNGRLAHLLSGRSLGGGIAYLNTLCSTSLGVAVSANMNSGYTPYPNYSWNVMVVAHEMGHNIGSQHTHDCVWNGNGTAIDGCGAINGCPDLPNPEGGGTIMSYCHLTSVGINLTKGFGPQPGQLLSDRYTEALCVTGENCAAVPPFNDVCARAIEPEILNYCNGDAIYSLEAATASDADPFGCGDASTTNDIWFRFEHTATNEIRVDVDGDTQLNELIVQAYTGTCTSLTSIGCHTSNTNGQVSIQFDNSYNNQDIYIRIAEDGSNAEGEFSLCVYDLDLDCNDLADTLNQIYVDNMGASWTNNEGWLAGANSGACDICNWYGVDCDKNGNIISIEMPNNNLTGGLSPSFLSLPQIRSLNLSYNNLSEMPQDDWDTLKVLRYLDLSHNQIADTLPHSFKEMAKINTIHLDHNQFNGKLVFGLGYNSSLRTFTASFNQLEGCFVNGTSSFCYKDSINLLGNAGLPYDGDVSLLCSCGYGSDSDNDGYCREINDCNDYDETIYQGADEISCDGKDNNCDGTVDEGSNHGPNVWIGPANGGDFQNAASWSLGHVPLVCEDVEIAMDQSSVNLLMKGELQNSDGGGSYYNSIILRNLFVGANAEVALDTSQGLNISALGRIENYGSFNVIGYVNFNYEQPADTSLLNYGTLDIAENGQIYIGKVDQLGVYNSANSNINNYGYFTIAHYQEPLGQYGIVNEGIINVFESLGVYGDFNMMKFVNKNTGHLELKDGSSYYSN